MTPSKFSVGFKLAGNLYEELKSIAEREHRSISSVLQQMVVYALNCVREKGTTILFQEPKSE